MSRYEYLGRLKAALEAGGLAPEDIKDAVNYYEEIFLDAGEANESKTAQSLGSPEDVARSILLENGININANSSFNDSLFGQNRNSGKSSKSGVSVSTIVIAAVTFPIWLPIVAVVGVMLFALAVVAFALAVSFWCIGVASAMTGIVLLFTVPPLGVALLGFGLLLIGILLICTLPITKSLKKMLAGSFGRLKYVVRKIFGKDEVNYYG